MLKTIQISDIDASNRLRPINPTWVSAFAEQIAAGEDLPAIEVVETDGGYRLVAGGHRLAAHAKLGLTEIKVEVLPERFADPDQALLREIHENMFNYGLTALDRAVHLAAWREVYERTNETDKRGGKRRGKAATETNSQDFAKRFSLAAAEALEISERSVQLAVKVASDIAKDVRERIAFLAIADTMSELLQLTQQTAERQRAIADMLAAEPPRASSVAEAVALIDAAPKPITPAAWERLSDKFSRLKPTEQARFFALHRAEFEAWLEANR
ncbi:ParB family chromosome partitioning protein [Breoghania corrubedonensis]|uniref:ParB family chromosome partitioning protein n=1 Tax=Breoghania corrubedonensis TaxID=665038 RepID=A0A2T5VCB6_9HYPH|nr:ParB/RepB/Spo0J family partition protein [Breoghania corrubedonensis]PTW61388.1 ParB family chromosome partitioning protein [Breoghania corrubedonensis]